MPPPKVIKSILKKNKNSFSDNVHTSVPAQVTHSTSDNILTNDDTKGKFTSKDKFVASNTHTKHEISNGHAKKVHLKDDQSICISDKTTIKEEKLAIKAKDHLHTVQVDIH